MNWKPPSIDSSHAMCQPDKRAPRITPPIRQATQPDKEAWLRERMARGKAPARSKRIELCLAQVCAQYGVTRGQLLGKSHSHTVAAARGQACRELRKLELSYPEIARALGINASSVIYHCQKGEEVAGKAIRKAQAAAISITYCEGGISL